ncbi:hypothetical protein SAMN05421630_102446 [Prauserella marina]|uniref:Uncharacterized protein n=1 Tax=Prauserella marina TaxID=530584 RepID=A0A1G6MCJ9_9PSEU|nr:hypothetical protein DES30_1011545 [Prauserella marina]SDC52974.1 hypothetical protein SAMN05421630_102446 [Prauserella marina]
MGLDGLGEAWRDLARPVGLDGPDSAPVGLDGADLWGSGRGLAGEVGLGSARLGP